MKYNFTNEEIKDMITSYKSGVSILTLSKKYGVDTSVIKKRLLDNDVEIIKGSPYSMNYWLARGMSPDEALKHKDKKKLNNPQYWIDKGYSEEEANIKIKYGYLVNLESFINKYGEEDGLIRWQNKLQKNINSNKKSSKRRLEYWISLGYSEKEAIEKRKEHQTTFTLEKCVNKHGPELGEKIYEKRQKEWVNKMDKLRDSINNDSFSLEFFKKKYGTEGFGLWCEKILKLTNNSDIIKPLFREDLTLNYLEHYVKNLNEPLTKKQILSISNSRVIKHLLKMTKNELTYCLKLWTYGEKTNSALGQIIRSDGYIFKSKTEFDLYCFFKEKNIKQIYEKNYPESKRKCDFYLPEIDLYVEYMGLYNLSDRLRNKEKITTKYRYIMREKTNLCLNNDLNCLFSSNIEEIKKNVLIKYEDKKNNSETN
jgi:hypothetical protein